MRAISSHFSESGREPGDHLGKDNLKTGNRKPGTHAKPQPANTSRTDRMIQYRTRLTFPNDLRSECRQRRSDLAIQLRPWYAFMSNEEEMIIEIRQGEVEARAAQSNNTRELRMHSGIEQ